MMGVFIQTNADSRLGRFRPLGYVIQESGCWQWAGTINAKGYGTCHRVAPHYEIRAHRMMYRRLKGPIPNGMQLDHLCRNRGCVNPDHLEPVSGKENALRGVGATARNARKTHCKGGHPLTPDNVITRKRAGMRTERQCRACKKLRKASQGVRYDRLGGNSAAHQREEGPDALS